MQKKKGISLIVLVITIIVMIILAASVVITLSNTGIINKANQAVQLTDEKQVQDLASLIWADAYMDSAKRDDIVNVVMQELAKQGITDENWNIVVNDKGVTITSKKYSNQSTDPTKFGLYKTGSDYSEQLISWQDLVESGTIVVNNRTVYIGQILPDDISELNEYGFYYDTVYTMSGIAGIVFNEDGSVEAYQNGVLAEQLPAGTAVYSTNVIDMSAAGWGEGKITSNGTMINFTGSELAFELGEKANVAGDLWLPDDGSILRLGDFNVETGVGNMAFAGSGLTGIKIPASVTTIGEGAFYGCTGISNIDIPYGVKNIDSEAFNGCTNLANVVIPNSVTNIGESAFYSCSSLTNVTLPNSVTSIGNRAFSHCDSLASVIISGGVKEIGVEAFRSCVNLTSVIIRDGVTAIGDRAFQYCSSLNNVTIPYSVTTVGEEAFRYCTSLSNLEIPDSIMSIGTLAFRNCTNLTYNIYDNAKYLGNKNNPYLVLVVAASENITSCNIHNDTKIIGSYAFYECTQLSNVNISKGVQSIDAAAFYYCSSLINITIPSTVRNIGSSAFYKCTSLKDVYYVGSKDDWEKIVKDGSSSDPTSYGATLHYNYKAN